MTKPINDYEAKFLAEMYDKAKQDKVFNEKLLASHIEDLNGFIEAYYTNGIQDFLKRNEHLINRQE